MPLAGISCKKQGGLSSRVLAQTARTLVDRSNGPCFKNRCLVVTSSRLLLYPWPWMVHCLSEAGGVARLLSHVELPFRKGQRPQLCVPVSVQWCSLSYATSHTLFSSSGSLSHFHTHLVIHSFRIIHNILYNHDYRLNWRIGNEPNNHHVWRI